MRAKNVGRVCMALFRIRFTESIQYRLAALSGASISLFWTLIEVTVYTIFFTYAQNWETMHGGLTLAQVITYLWITQCMVPLQSMGVDGEILGQITGGNVSLELCRPLGLYEHWFAKTAAGRLGGFWLRAPLFLLVGILLPSGVGIGAPASTGGLLLGLVSMAAAFLLCSAYAMFVTAVRLNITWGEGPTYILLLIPGVLSGNYLPLQLWPDALQTLLLYQPFAGYSDIPSRLFVGSMDISRGGVMILAQVGWSAFFILCGKLVMRRKLQTLIVQGG